MMVMALKGHFFTQMPQPIHMLSLMKEILESGVTSIQNLPDLTTGQDRLHSCLHRRGLHLSALTMAIRVALSLDDIRVKYRDSWNSPLLFFNVMPSPKREKFCQPT